jgi:hypothetical protein
LCNSSKAIIGLYLNPPEHAIVLCADEKSQIQALDAKPSIQSRKPSLQAPLS